MNKESSALLGLKNQLSTIIDHIDRRQRIIFVDYPLYPNIGDLLINLGTEELFASSDLTVARRYSYHDFPNHIPDLQDVDVFMFHGGGNLGDLYPEHINLLGRILKQYPRNQVIILPQTIHFKDTKNLVSCSQGLLRHPRLTIFVRDFRSKESLASVGLSNVTLMPDMAHYLFGCIHAEPGHDNSQALYFIRRDEELGSVPSFMKNKLANSVDWEDCISFSDRVAFGLLIRSVRAARSMGISGSLYRPWYKVRDRMVKSGIHLISQSEQIYTNRLHAMLLALLLGKETIAFDNSYGKLSTYYEAWLKSVPHAKFMREEGP